MKRTLCLFIVFVLAVSGIMANGNGEAKVENASNSVELIMGSWRTDDTAQMKAVLGEFTKQHPNIKVVFQPTIPAEYNTTLRMQLEGGLVLTLCMQDPLLQEINYIKMAFLQTFLL
ncbi:hypothetical protein [Thiospirochaeta perfilievii]|uniref:hypothetical protein n=1 Tax=Thiospirochaeta perfilievii TaxID=252967 RepID=UPI001FF02F64|nr:hypothetical protein [Thiospirochaeta perfilievii]